MGKVDGRGQGSASCRAPVRAGAPPWQGAPNAGDDTSAGAQNSRLCTAAAPMKEAKSGCGSKGRDFSSGWNCTPTNQG